MDQGISVFDMLGLLGVAIGISCYARVQWRREFAKSFYYSAGNFLSSLLTIVSLLDRWNLASFTSNVAWLLLSLYGMFRCFKYHWEARHPVSASVVEAGAS